MPKTRLILILIFIFAIGVNTVIADVPSVISLEVTDETGGRSLTITIRHNAPTIVHYVSEIEVKVGDEVDVIELESQSTITFTEQVSITTTGDVQVRAFCTFHGWSSWVSLQGDSEPVDEPSEGIPGFPVLALGLGLAVYALLRYK
jgi:desulfoferrodoxin (superoxide reductase-like protein)